MLGAEGIDTLIACYDRVQARTDGLIRKLRTSVATTLTTPEVQTVGFRAGPTMIENALTLDVSDFSALLLGSVRFRALHAYGRATVVDPAHVATIDRLFLADAPPICTTGF